MEKKKRVGIMGGTFNPIHNGHLAIARAVLDTCSLDFVIFMPNGAPAYKDHPTIDDADREQMVKLAITGQPGFVYSDFEIAQHDITYTANTLPAYQKLHPDWELYYIVGSDSLCYMDRWYHPEVIFSSAKVIAACRDTQTPQEMEQYRNFLTERYHGDIRLVYNALIPISSTQVRKAIAENQSVEDLIPPQVFHYIQERGLYHGKGSV
jgi:nicotinate-nucleotide adenylyltransferase